MTPLTSGITARRMYGLVEPIGLIPYAADEPAEALLALGLRNYWDTYFAGRPAPLGRDVPAGVVHAIFCNFAPGETARHIPRVWDLITPEAALAARDQGCVAALRRMLGDHRTRFTWGTETIGFELTPAPDGGTIFVLTEELSANAGARNAAGWDACLDRLQHSREREHWKARFGRYTAELEPLLGHQDGPPAGYNDTTP
jgi:hypothetical protein